VALQRFTSSRSVLAFLCPFLQVGVVKEVRPYTQWAASPLTQAEVGMNTGIMSAKAELNALHRELAEQGFNQVQQSTASNTTVAQCVSALQT